MPQLGGGGGSGDDLGATDEMLAFKDEGEQEEKIPQGGFPERDLADLKSSLVNESEGAGSSGQAGSGPGQTETLRRASNSQRLYQDKLPDALEEGLKAQDSSSVGMYKESVYSGYNLLVHYPANGVSAGTGAGTGAGAGTGPGAVSGAGQPLHTKPGQPSHGVPQLTPLYEHFSSHPTHVSADINQKQGVHRPLQTTDLSSFYSLSPGGVGQISHTMGWFTHPSLMLSSGMHTTGIPHPAIVPHSGKQELQHYDRGLKPPSEAKQEKEAKKPTIKKPLNAFMLYMKEMRAKVIAECTLKESAAINQILGRRWHALSREEQAKYYELARKERQLHMQLYPGWSARDNYGKKKRRSREKHQESNTDPGSPKKCRARFGLNQQTDWCGPCRRKKKCIRYLQGEGEGRCTSPISSDGSAIDSPPSPLDALQYVRPAFTPDQLTSPTDYAHRPPNCPFSLSLHLKPTPPGVGLPAR
ncbi:transcription factor 7 isoform X4 [Monodelphis domestica]|uniref:transcription factor 7 isoform X4 n=1 Tax=Monodelphis domestica TaxID=13616 RepID=UPI000443508A|nr:transcription factor 7 isoform X4 [Monodelphis domestica]